MVEAMKYGAADFFEKPFDDQRSGNLLEVRASSSSGRKADVPIRSLAPTIAVAVLAITARWRTLPALPACH